MKNLKKREFLEADKPIAQTVVLGLSQKDNPLVIVGCKAWLNDINEQLATLDAPA